MNDGTCIDRVDGFLCNCTASYNGSMCNIGIVQSVQSLVVSAPGVLDLYIYSGRTVC